MLGTRRFAVPAGSLATVRIALKPSVRRSLARTRSLKSALRIVGSDSAGRTLTLARKVTLLAAKRPAGR
jgi:hypothetical protein